ncbi:uncharacterized protein LOC135468706 isoform X2 [Liolophura sinensis]|uniref:uncharacterized protein LOC135468706 isoform X2 n=1 Tax=Liolophura sinensis TaxID=3198878 RepID=UPI003158B9A8
MKTRQLNSEELNLKWLGTREVILRTQSQKFLSDMKLLENQLLEAQDHLQEEYEGFCAQTREFTKGYSLVENGQEMRKGKANRQLAMVMDEKKALENDLQTYKKMKAKVVLMEEQKEAVRARLNLLLAEEKDLQGKVKVEKQKVDSVVQEKKRVSEIPQTGPEFTRLHKELETLKTQNYEKDCQELQQELQKLQQCLWQKQVKSQRVLAVGRHQRKVPLFSCQGSNPDVGLEDDLSFAELKDVFSEDLTAVPQGSLSDMGHG